jgi:phosphohistidine phosphatase SixA
MLGQLLLQMTMRRLLSLLIVFSASLVPVAAADHPQIVVLVRHAEKAAAPAGDVALSSAGQARAEELALALAEARLDTIVTTQFRRTRETAAPVGAGLNLTPVVVQAGADTASHVKAVAAAVRAGGHSVLVVGHANTVPAIITALGGPVMQDLCDTEYSNLFTLALVPGQPARLVHGHYGAPDAEPTADCHKQMKQ